MTDRDPRLLRLGPEVVAVVKGHGSLALHLQNGIHVPGDGGQGPAMVLGRVTDSQFVQLGQVTDRNVGSQVVGRGLVGDDVGDGATLHHGRVNFGGVAHQPDGQGFALSAGLIHPGQGLVQVGSHTVAVAFLQLALDALGTNLHVQDHALIHGHCQGLGAAHAPHAGGEDQFAFERGHPVVLLGCCQVGLVGALEDALGADVDPRAGGHLAVHHQARPVQRVELLLGGPAGNQVGVGDDNAGGVGEGFGHIHRPAGLNTESLIFGQSIEGGGDFLHFVPVTGHPAGAAIDDELFPVDGVGWVEVVVQHPFGGLGVPGGGSSGGAGRCL
ncbi:hypothetical protein ES703_12132 [subsurface metagenome]